MAKNFVIPEDREFLMSRMGDISQLAGLKRYEFIDGKAKGVEAVDIKTGSGFSFTVLPGRGMDIAWADYKGTPLSYISKTGIVSPAYYEEDGVNWLRSFFAGLLTTCGLSNVGWPCEEEDPFLGKQKYGLHGRISNTAADNVCVQEEWENNSFIMTVSGRLRQSMLHGENLVLKRKIRAFMGENRFTINDVVENEGFIAQPLMLLYHFNIGYPVLSENSRFVCNSENILAGDESAAENIATFDKCHPPIAGCGEKLYFHDLKTDENHDSYLGVINDELEIGAGIKINKKQLPKLTQWKQLSRAEYVLGIEPANCLPRGRVKQRESGDLQYIQPGEKKRFDIEFKLLVNKESIDEFEQKVNKLAKEN